MIVYFLIRCLCSHESFLSACISSTDPRLAKLLLSHATIVALNYCNFQLTQNVLPRSQTRPDWHRDSEFNACRTLKNFENEAEALRTLHRCAFKVAPIVRKRGWKIPYLVEIPGDGQLRGYNRALADTEGPWSTDTIAIVVRDGCDPNYFLPMGEIMQTMIYELAHVKYNYHLFHFCLMDSQLMRELHMAYESGAIGPIPSCDIPTTTGKDRHQTIEDVWEVN